MDAGEVSAIVGTSQGGLGACLRVWGRTQLIPLCPVSRQDVCVKAAVGLHKAAGRALLNTSGPSA